MFFPISAYQDASVEYNHLNIKIGDIFSLGALGCFLTCEEGKGRWSGAEKLFYDVYEKNLGGKIRGIAPWDQHEHKKTQTAVNI